ncbi:hypothetical protein GW17_00033442 [Ensete ventricosum]|nr:hypothetical protein GW17_00033442 [Ensete ventricosum]
MHFYVRRELREWILIDLEFGIPHLEAPKGNLVPELIGDKASMLKFAVESLNPSLTLYRTLGGHVLRYGCLITCLLCPCPGLLSMVESQIEL